MLIVLKVDHPKKGFTVLLNETLRNTGLTGTAFRLHIYLLTCSIGFCPTIYIMAQKLSVSNSTIERAIAELRKKGFLQIKKIKDKKTGLYEVTWIVSEKPKIKVKT